MLSERKKLLSTYYHTHRQNLNLRMLKIAFIYLLLSICWNSIFLLFKIPYSRANIYFLLLSIIVLLTILFTNRLLKIQPTVMQHIVLLFVAFVIICMYFGSGYREAWAYFLLIPILSGLYGDLLILFIYSTIGLIAMLLVGLFFPLVTGIFDSIDISNRI